MQAQPILSCNNYACMGGCSQGACKQKSSIVIVFDKQAFENYIAQLIQQNLIDDEIPIPVGCTRLCPQRLQ